MENFNIEIWLDEIKTKLQIEFKEQLLFIGFQGSYARGEAADKSDIDLVVILHHVNLDTLKRYKNIIKNMPFADKCCGFVSGVNEIKNWSKSDLFQFYYETKPLYGNIKNIISAPQKDDIKLSIKMSVEKLYHSACHTFLYENRTAEALECLYKMTFFILQAKYFTDTSKYICTKKQLSDCLKGRDKKILEICINRDKIQSFDNNRIEELFELLICWCSQMI